MSNITGDSRSFSSGNTGEEVQQHQQVQNQFIDEATRTNSNGSTSQQPLLKKKRNLPGTPDPSAEVIALSPTTLMATNRFICEICNKGFQRDQNLQLHRRGHNLPWKLKQRTSAEIRKRVYICPETTCVHHNPARALGDLTGIKKHFCRKHGEKKWKCDKCSKKYAVQSDWKAHSKTCGTREYKCDCGTIFSRRDSFITHRAFCDALAEENNKVSQGLLPNMGSNVQGQVSDHMSSMPINTSNTPIGISEFNHNDLKNPTKSLSLDPMPMHLKSLNMSGGMFSNSSGNTLYNGQRSMSSTAACLQLSPNTSSSFDGVHDSKTSLQITGSAHMSATALLQKAAQMGASASASSNNINSPTMQKNFVPSMAGREQISNMRPSTFGGMNSMQQSSNNCYDNMQSQTDQTQLGGVDGGGFMNQFFHNKSPQEMSSQLIDTTVGVDNDLGMYSGLFMGGGGSGDQQYGFPKNMEHENSSSSSTTSMFQGNSSSSSMGIPASGRNPTGPSRFSGNSNAGDVMTVDFLGVGGSRSASLHEQHRRPHHHQDDQQQQEQEGLEFGVDQHRMQGLHPYQQEVSHGQATMENPIWET